MGLNTDPFAPEVLGALFISQWSLLPNPAKKRIIKTIIVRREGGSTIYYRLTFRQVVCQAPTCVFYLILTTTQ